MTVIREEAIQILEKIPRATLNYINKLFMLLIIIAVAGILIYLIQVTFRFIIKARFSKKYGIEKLPKSIRIKKARDKAKSCNYFVLKYPYWQISKKMERLIYV